jgi:hypothetical protein
MIRLLFTFLILSVGLLHNALSQPFSGQVYVMTDHFTTDRCRPQIECDCCSSDIVFITDREFVMVDKCMYNDSYYRGKYTVTKEDLTLMFDQFVVKETYNDDTKETKIEKRNLKITSINFYISNCKAGDLELQRTDLKVLTKAFKESSEKTDQTIKELKKTKAWGQLQ